MTDSIVVTTVPNDCPNNNRKRLENSLNRWLDDETPYPIRYLVIYEDEFAFC